MDKKIMRVIIKAADVKTFTDMLTEYHLDTAGEHRDKDGKIVTEAFVPSKKIDQLLYKTCPSVPTTLSVLKMDSKY